MARGRTFVILGNPSNRRVGLFQESLARRGREAAQVLPWIDMRFDRLPDEPAIVRIESFGEDFDVEREMLARGYDDAVKAGCWAVPDARGLAPDHGRILAPRQMHLGFLRVLGELEVELAKRPWLSVFPSPASIRELFDKRACAATFARLGVPIPEPVAATSIEEVRAAGRCFIKLTCGSSASCLAYWDGEGLFTSMEIDGENLYNSLRPRRYLQSAAIDRLLGFLLREGSHVERHVPKARVGPHYFDTRMLVIDGEVRFTVVRKSKHLITNLHLGGQRGTIEELEEVVSEDAIEAAHESCRKVFSAYDCLHLGIDVMFTPDGRDHRILEANAFGDLLPNLENLGMSVYEWEIESCST